MSVHGVSVRGVSVRVCLSRACLSVVCLSKVCLSRVRLSRMCLSRVRVVDHRNLSWLVINFLFRFLNELTEQYREISSCTIDLAFFGKRPVDHILYECKILSEGI